MTRRLQEQAVIFYRDVFPTRRGRLVMVVKQQDFHFGGRRYVAARKVYCGFVTVMLGSEEAERPQNVPVTSRSNKPAREGRAAS
jgi:hypothetical protein